MSTNTTVSTLRQRMIKDMAARKLGPQSQRGHIYSRNGRTCTGWIAPAFGWRTYSITHR
jgi:hypothetical protein